jgi:kumamolisin
MNNSNLDSLELRPLPGSEREPVQSRGRAGAAPGEVDPDANIEVTVVLRRRGNVPESALTSPHSHEDLLARYGADPADVDLVTSTLTDLGAQVVDIDAADRHLRVAGPVGVLTRIFGTELRPAVSVDSNGSEVSHRARSGGLSVPAPLDGVVTAVLGLDDRPQASPRLRVAAAAATKSYTPIELEKVYNFPPDTDGTGQSIAILELGGGFGHADLRAYFASLGLSNVHVRAVGVDGARNVPGGDPQGADGEVLLDIEVIGSMAPGSRVVVYFTPNTDAGFLDALVKATHAAHTPAAISISWGASEDEWTDQARQAFDDALTDAALLGVTVTAAAGDDGSNDRETDGKPHVDFPASSPHILACGGTRLDADGSTGTVASETVWNNGVGNGATGGGVSVHFERPSWQASVGVPEIDGHSGRGVPDVAGDADPQTGYAVRIDGQNAVIGGTSAVAPLWAALVARLAEASGHGLGLIQPMLYGSTGAGEVPPGFRDVTTGNNGAYQAGPGWDACTGLGVPNGAELLAALKQD